MTMNERIYLLTGAAGFLGSNICLQLLEKGAVDAYHKVEDAMVDKLFRKEGETVQEAKERLRK